MSKSVLSAVEAAARGTSAVDLNASAEVNRERFLELQERFKFWLGDTGRVAKAPKRKAGKRKKILVLNDIHAPFHNEAALARAINDNRDADECWVVGDVLDLFSFSRYDKTSRPFSPIEEFQSGRVIMAGLAEAFPTVRVMHGNHDDRYIKYLVRAHIPPDVLEFMKYSFPNSLSPLAKLCADLPNVQMMEPKRIDYASYPFIHQIGDCVLSHAERYSRLTNKAVSDVIEWLMKKAKPMGIVDDFKVVIQAHTHSAGKTWNDYGVVGIESGCLALTPDYDGSPKLMGRQPVVGYTVVVQEDGRTLINETNFIQIQ